MAWTSYYGGSSNDGFGYGATIRGAQDADAMDIFESMDALLSTPKEHETWAINSLKNIGDTYSEIVSSYKGDMDPLIDAMNEDIAGAYKYLEEEYMPYVQSVEGDFTDGVEVEKSDGQRRSRYMGGIADQSAAAEDQMRREAESQGINFYANRGSKREMLMDRNAGMANASNAAYSDWLVSHNQQVGQDQAAKKAYADMLKSPMDARIGIMKARGTPLEAMSNMASIEAHGAGLQADAAGKLLDHSTAQKNQGLQANVAKLDYTAAKNNALTGAQAKLGASANTQIGKKSFRGWNTF